MVAWYKHDIPAWMDGTEALSDGAYRTYHVICQLIYLNEGPVALNEHGIAGRCRQSLRAFRRNLNELVQSGKLTLENGRLRNSRADVELEKVDENRINASKGGMISGESRNIPDKPLKTHDPPQATLREDRSLIDETRLDETRQKNGARETRAGGEASAKPKRGTRLDGSWQPSKEDREAAFALGLRDADIGKIWPVYRDYWLGCAGAKGIKHDWGATWRNWCRREAERLGRVPPTAAQNGSIDWDSTVSLYRNTGVWSRHAGCPEPGYSGCKAPSEILQKYGYGVRAETIQQ